MKIKASADSKKNVVITLGKEIFIMSADEARRLVQKIGEVLNETGFSKAS